VHHSFLNLERILTLMIKREKGLELKNYRTHLSTFGSKMFFTLKFMDLKNAPLTKVVHIYMIKGMNA
jgi:hypothetical protein